MLSRLLLAFSFITTAYSIPSVDEYFPDLAGNLTKIEWFHAVNNQKLLAEALNSSVHMLEADVIYGKLTNGTGPMPIMGHPPATESDLSLKEFVESVIEVQGSQKKGIKLDFKSDKAYAESWSVLEPIKDQLIFPVWLNADILKGPDQPTSTPLNASTFVRSARDKLPTAPLSLGWTTYFKEGIGYTPEMLQEMQHVIENEKVLQPVTLAVRAAFAAYTKQGLVDLVRSIDKSQQKNQTTLTVWMSSATDKVNIAGLKSLLAELSVARVALDVPEDIRDELLGNAAPASQTPSLLSYFSIASLISLFYRK